MTLYNTGEFSKLRQSVTISFEIPKYFYYFFVINRFVEICRTLKEQGEQNLHQDRTVLI